MVKEIEIKYLEPGYAHNIPPVYCKSTGKAKRGLYWNEEAAWNKLAKNSYQRMAMARLIQAFFDLSAKPKQLKKSIDNSIQNKAIHFIFHTDDFFSWCDSAGVCPRTFRENAQKYLDTGDIWWRTEHGKRYDYEEKKLYREKLKNNKKVKLQELSEFYDIV